MRIVAGSARGRKLKVPKGTTVRPTLDRVREALFSSLGGRVIEARVLDLFAGSGALGLEALSRGATHVDFVEKHPITRRVLEENIADLKFGDRARVFGRDAFAAMVEFQKTKRVFDLIFLDPPYDTGLLEKSLVKIDGYGLLAEGGVIIGEHPSTARVIVPKSLHVARTKSYGSVSLAVIQRIDASDSDARGEIDK